MQLGGARLHVLFIHSAGAQDSDDSSRPLLRGLQTALPTDVAMSAPTMPTPDDPYAQRWSDALDGHVGSAVDRFVLVGHSLGGSTILQYLATHPAPANLRGVVTVAAPYWGMPDWAVAAFALPDDIGALDTVPIVLYGSSDDETVPTSHLERYGERLPGAVRRKVAGTGHLFDTAPFAMIAADVMRLLRGPADGG